jgi:CRP/FNR family transcriptional regulator, anaerobic regulatory protein
MFLQKILSSLGTISTEKTFSKGDVILKENEIEQNVYFVKNGALRLFYNAENEEQTIRLGYKDSLITSLASFFNNTPSQFCIDAIRKTNVYVIPKQAIRQLANENVASVQSYIQLLETLLTQQNEREIDLLTTSPTERLERVLKRSPNLFQEIPLKYIASYLRMTPETLSRIRNS